MPAGPREFFGGYASLNDVWANRTMNAEERFSVVRTAKVLFAFDPDQHSKVGILKDRNSTSGDWSSSAGERLQEQRYRQESRRHRVQNQPGGGSSTSDRIERSDGGRTEDDGETRDSRNLGGGS